MRIRNRMAALVMVGALLSGGLVVAAPVVQAASAAGPCYWKTVPRSLPWYDGRCIVLNPGTLADPRCRDRRVWTCG